MLIAARSLRDFSFSRLMEVYEEGNRKTGAERYPHETPERQLALAEADFREYLDQVFFRGENPVYLIWEDRGRYCSALRLEGCEDGVLLEALETAPGVRRKGYGTLLLQQTEIWLAAQGGGKLYSHVSRQNTASLRTHEKCGFRQILDYARYIDGSVSRRAVTLLCETASMGNFEKTGKSS